jgi:hypothetical protein
MLTKYYKILQDLLFGPGYSWNSSESMRLAKVINVPIPRSETNHSYDRSGFPRDAPRISCNGEEGFRGSLQILEVNGHVK